MHILFPMTIQIVVTRHFNLCCWISSELVTTVLKDFATLRPNFCRHAIFGVDKGNFAQAAPIAFDLVRPLMTMYWILKQPSIHSTFWQTLPPVVSLPFIPVLNSMSGTALQHALRSGSSGGPKVCNRMEKPRKP